MMKFAMTFLKRVVFTFGLLYGINLLLSSANLIMPINIWTLLIPSFFGIPGVISLFALLFIIK